MSDEPLALKAPAARAFEVEAMRFEIRYTLFEDKPLCPKTTAWLRRLQTALVDEHCSTESYPEIEKAAFEVIPAEEAEELRRREATGRLSSGTKELTGAGSFVSAATERSPALDLPLRWPQPTHRKRE